MAHESFEDAHVADVLNREFVSIKLDREERPDVDRVYMLFVQATTGAGGWPMSVWLTPELKPFFGGTYFPPESRWGRPGFVDVLVQLARAWRSDRAKVLESAESVLGRLRSMAGAEAEPGAGDRSLTRAPVAGREALVTGINAFAQAFDGRHGGFGGAPKFPRPAELLCLLAAHVLTGESRALQMALHTLRAMAVGGMRDHIGGGFHRYSVDAEWRVPHFEKMLYDQAQLVLAYVEAAQVTDDQFFADVAVDTLEYVRRDLTDPEGGFYSAEDADSVPPEHAGDPDAHKTEGAFYIWTDEEVREVLGADAEVFASRFGVKPGGNAPFDPQDEFKNKNLLYTARPIAEIGQAAGSSALEVVGVLERSRRALFQRRTSRPRPHLDDKVLTAWNGLMIAAFARAARSIEGGDGFLNDATRAARFVRTHLWAPVSKTLLRRYRKGEAGIDGYAEDYAFLIFGLLELFQAGGDPEWLDWALTLQERQDALFRDPIDGGWFSTTGLDPSVLLRLKEDYDHAEPAASSVSLLNLLTLSHLVAGDAARGFEEEMRQAFGGFASKTAQMSRGVPMLLAALSIYHAGLPQIVLVGDPNADDARALREALQHIYRPAATVVPVLPEHRESLARLLPWIADMRGVNGRAAAYVCRDFTCQLPATSPAELIAQLS